jgi:sodium/bile acid cotransporter 7
VAGILSFLKQNWFIFGIFIAVVVGYYFPAAAAIINKNGYFTTLLIIIVFFFQGLTIPKEKIIVGFKNIKLHIFILFFTFVFYPLYFFIAVKILPFNNYNAGIIAGMFILACLPTTIVASSVYTNIAGGNAISSVFNSVISNIIGVFITPMLFSLLLMSWSSFGLPLSMLLDILMSLVIRIIIPMVIGMVLRNFAIKFIDANKKKFSIATSCAILFIVFTAFASSSNIITLELIKDLYPMFIFLGATFLFIVFFVYKIAGLLKFETNDVIAAVFNSSHKTLSMGVPLITLYFVNNQELLGLVLIPLLFYHPWQLFLSGFIANFFQKQNMKTKI